jgi:hypothetical protein
VSTTTAPSTSATVTVAPPPQNVPSSQEITQ